VGKKSTRGAEEGLALKGRKPKKIYRNRRDTLLSFKKRKAETQESPRVEEEKEV